ncbi:helix-turn-helix domain-containing protein [Amycolatopsis sp. NPDC001319]|uniref:helix-turn-helix domain-containing protein n=1 Tax=unclassified Amycolatopsis TaxID=2618356 RepID=UPI0036AB7032
MQNHIPNAGGPAFYSTTDAAWILAVDLNAIHRAIRVGEIRTVQRRSRLVIPAAELRRVLNGGAR